MCVFTSFKLKANRSTQKMSHSATVCVTAMTYVYNDIMLIPLARDNVIDHTDAGSDHIQNKKTADQKTSALHVLLI